MKGSLICAGEGRPGTTVSGQNMKGLRELVTSLDAKGEPYVLVTVVRRVRPSSARVGDKAIVTANGEMTGFVGGHCTRELVVQQATECLRTGERKLLLVTSHPPVEIEEGVTVLPMTCASDGTVELFLEPRLSDPPLVIVGASQIADNLADLASRFGFLPHRISLEDQQTETMAEDPCVRLRQQFDTTWNKPVFGVVATMGRYDAEALSALADVPFQYMGLVTSPRRWTALRRELLEAGVRQDFIDLVTAPAGLNIGSVGPEEIALSILAQMVAGRRQGTQGTGGDTAVPPAGQSENPLHLGDSQGIDLVCGMTVDLAKSPYRFELDGTTYGFCCAGCRERFARDPEIYLHRRA